jgi:hypothetical protein
MKLGISRNMHGYDEIDTSDQVTVRSEVARLTRLFDRAVRNNTANNPDIYQGNQTGSTQDVKLRQSVAIPSPAVAILPPQGGVVDDTIVAPVPAIPDPDASPATVVAFKKNDDDDDKDKKSDKKDDDVKKTVKIDDGKTSDSKKDDSTGSAAPSSSTAAEVVVPSDSKTPDG